MAHQLFTLPKATPVTAGSVVLPGSKLYFYETGTTTPQDTYSDSGLTTPNANPVVADANGLFGTIYLDPTLAYKATLTTSADVLQYTVDPANDQLLSQDSIGQYLYPITTAEISGAATPTNYGYRPGDIRRYGAVLDGSTSDHAAFQLADAQAAVGGFPIFIPRSSGGMATSTALTVDYRSDVTFESGAFIKYTGSSNIVVLTIGTAGQVAFSRRYERLWVTRANQSDWTNDGNVGIRFLAVAGSHIDITEVSKHTIGMETLPASSSGFQGNQVFLGHLYSNRYGVSLSNATDGFSNDNTFYSGRFQGFSGVNDATSRFGIRITSSDAVYTNNNGNRFFGPLIEMNGPVASGEAVGIWVEYGADNHFFDVRSEGNDVSMRCSNDAARNVAEFGYDGSSTTRLEQLGTSVENIAIGMLKRPKTHYTTPVFAINDLGRKARGTSGTSILVEGLLWGNSSTATRTNVSGTSVTYDGNYITIGTTRCMGVYVDTSVCKEFVVRRSGTAGGRVRVTAYDAADGGGSIISTTGAVLGTSSTPFTYDGSSFGGSWGVGSDFLSDVYFRVSSATQSIFVLITGGSASAVISSFGVYAQANQDGVRYFTGAYTSPGEITGGAYTVTNLTTDRTYDADTVAVAELADIVGTLIADLKTLRVLR